MQVTDEMVNRFLNWPLPKSVRPDPCVMNPEYPHRVGTNLLTAIEARQMLEHVLAAAGESETRSSNSSNSMTDDVIYELPYNEDEIRVTRYYRDLREATPPELHDKLESIYNGAMLYARPDPTMRPTDAVAAIRLLQRRASECRVDFQPNRNRCDCNDCIETRTVVRAIARSNPTQETP